MLNQCSTLTVLLALTAAKTYDVSKIHVKHLTRPQSSLLRKERSARGDGKEERGREKRPADPESKSCAKSRKVVRGRFCDVFRRSCIHYGQLAYLTYFFHRSVLPEVFLRVLGFDPRWSPAKIPRVWLALWSFLLPITPRVSLLSQERRLGTSQVKHVYF